MTQVVSTHNTVYKGRCYGPNNGTYNRSLPFNKQYYNGRSHEWEDSLAYHQYCKYYDIGILGQGPVNLGVEMVTFLVDILRFMEEWRGNRFGAGADYIISSDDAEHARVLAQRIYDTMPPGDIRASDGGLIKAAGYEDLCQYVYINASDASIMLRAIPLYAVYHKNMAPPLIRYFDWLWDILYKEHQQDYCSDNLFVPGFIGTSDELRAGKGSWKEGYCPLKPLTDLKYFKEYESKVREATTFQSVIDTSKENN
jgi:hypothetical protein